MGWNSTAQDAADQGGAARFNSQRDGILPRGAQQPLASLSEVSIPNGMEFYAEGGKGSGMDMSFNSQRDGILP